MRYVTRGHPAFPPKLTDHCFLSPEQYRNIMTQKKKANFQKAIDIAQSNYLKEKYVLCAVVGGQGTQLLGVLCYFYYRRLTGKDCQLTLCLDPISCCCCNRKPRRSRKNANVLDDQFLMQQISHHNRKVRRLERCILKAQRNIQFLDKVLTRSYDLKTFNTP